MAQSKIGDAIASSEQAMAEQAQREADAAAAAAAVSDDVSEAARLLSIRPSEVLEVQFIDELGVAINTIDGLWYLLTLPGVTDANGRSGLLLLTPPKYPCAVPVYAGRAGQRFLTLRAIEGQLNGLEDRG